MVTALVDDLSATDTAASSGDLSQATSGGIRASLLGDIARARSLGPPDGGLSVTWANALAQVEAVAGALGEDTVAQDPQLRARAEAATEALVSFVASMQRAGA